MLGSAGVDTKYTQRLALDVGDMLGHQIRLY
jgi:hypothetical protein